MEFIKPAEISAKIISLIAEADKELVIVSPYNNFSNWNKLLRYLNEANDRGVNINYFVRKGERHKGFEKTKIRPVEVENLHAKIYFNEKYAIASSMNLVEYSDMNSLDFAILIENPEMYGKVKDFYKRYILKEKREIENLISPNVSLPEDLKQERFFEEFYFSPRQNLYDFFVGAMHKKEYHKNSTFIKEFGFVDGLQRKHGLWLEFSNKGLLNCTTTYKNGTVENRDQVRFDKKISLYWIMASLANIVGGLYQVPVSELYFQSYISIYVKGDPEKLYNYLEETIGIKLKERYPEKFDYLCSNIKELLYYHRPF